MKKTIIVFLSFIMYFGLFVSTMLPTPVYADMGPKKSIVINFIGVDDGQEYWATLLRTSGGGPFSKYSEESEYYSTEDKAYNAWRKFGSFKDEDGYGFYQLVDECTSTHQFKWGYFAPYNFKVLVYFPKTDTFAVSQVYKQYAFHSYYEVDLSYVGNQDYLIDDGVYQVGARVSCSYHRELIGFFARVILTVLIEIVLALICGIYGKKAILTIVLTNVITQLLFNLALNLVVYSGFISFILIGYFLAELFVIIIESVVYTLVVTRCKRKNKFGEKANFKSWYVILYAIIANVISMITGFALLGAIPQIF